MEELEIKEKIEEIAEGHEGLSINQPPNRPIDCRAGRTTRFTRGWWQICSDRSHQREFASFRSVGLLPSQISPHRRKSKFGLPDLSRGGVTWRRNEHEWGARLKRPCQAKGYLSA
jgi:hypothetical protein